MKNPFRIRDMKLEDAEKVKKVALESWRYTYSDIYSNEEIEEYIENYYNVKALRQTLEYNNQELFDFIVMEDTRAGEVIGFSQIGYDKFYENKPEVKENEIKLFRIYLHPDYIGKGLGKKLVRKSEEFVRNNGRDRYFLYVHSDNKIGRKFYDKMGFERIKEFDEDDEIYLRKVLDN